MKLTQRKAAAMTKEKWDWHYRHPSLKNNSDDFPKIANGKWNLKWDCPDCEYVKQQILTGNFLSEEQCKQHCPHIWPEGRCIPYNRFSEIKSNHYFGKWKTAKTLQERKKYAKLIRDLPERK